MLKQFNSLAVSLFNSQATYYGTPILEMGRVYTTYLKAILLPTNLHDGLPQTLETTRHSRHTPRLCAHGENQSHRDSPNQARRIHRNDPNGPIIPRGSREDRGSIRINNKRHQGHNCRDKFRTILLLDHDARAACADFQNVRPRPHPGPLRESAIFAETNPSAKREAKIVPSSIWMMWFAEPCILLSLERRTLIGPTG